VAGAGRFCGYNNDWFMRLIVILQQIRKVNMKQSTEKLSYLSPVLVCYGKAAELTQGGSLPDGYEQKASAGFKCQSQDIIGTQYKKACKP
jgi:hypothetical protein